MTAQQKITIITARGTFTGTLDPEDLTGLEDEKDPASVVLQCAADGHFDSLRLLTETGYVLIGSNALSDSVIEVEQAR